MEVTLHKTFCDLNLLVLTILRDARLEMCNLKQVIDREFVIHDNFMPI